MRLYEVQSGDTPASIASKPEMAGCPKCSIDLIRANPHKATVVHPNGFTTFKELFIGEKLALPEKWFNGDLDSRPRAYFAALPHPDGVTPSSLGLAAPGVLGDFAALDAASVKVGALASMDDQPFSDSVNDAASAIDLSVQEVSGTGAPAVYAIPYAQAVRASTAKARQRNVSLAAAITANDKPTAFQTRLDILHDFADALGSARLALTAFHGDPTQAPAGPTTVAFSTTMVAAAQAATTAIAADPNFCTSIAQPGSAVNSAVHAFKTAWNAANPGSPVPINTGNYEQATADVLTRVLGTAPAACAPRATTPPSSVPSNGTLTPPQDQGEGLSVGAILGLGVIGAAGVGTAIYFATRAPTPLVRRVRPRPSPGSRPGPGPGPILRPRKHSDTIGPWRNT